MKNKSTYFLVIFASLLSLQACEMQPLSETEYQPTTAGYEDVRNNQQRRSINIASGNNNAVQNPSNVPVIINDPFAISRSLSANPVPNSGLGNNVYVSSPQGLVPVQAGNPYGSLANTEDQVIEPNVLINNSAYNPNYQRPSFGSNIYSPVR